MAETYFGIADWQLELPLTWEIIELSVKSSKESTETASLLKSGNKVVEVGWVHSKVEDEEGKQTRYHYLTDNSNLSANHRQIMYLAYCEI
jgi:hypothetical protein